MYIQYILIKAIIFLITQYSHGINDSLGWLLVFCAGEKCVIISIQSNICLYIYILFQLISHNTL